MYSRSSESKVQETQGARPQQGGANQESLGKRWAERESAKKAKTDVSVEVKSPRIDSRAEEIAISLHLSNFIPPGSPDNAPRSPSHARELPVQGTAETVVLCRKMSKFEKNNLVNEACAPMLTGHT